MLHATRLGGGKDSGVSETIDKRSGECVFESMWSNVTQILLHVLAVDYAMYLATSTKGKRKRKGCGCSMVYLMIWASLYYEHSKRSRWIAKMFLFLTDQHRKKIQTGSLMDYYCSIHSKKIGDVSSLCPNMDSRSPKLWAKSMKTCLWANLSRVPV